MDCCYSPHNSDWVRLPGVGCLPLYTVHLHLGTKASQYPNLFKCDGDIQLTVFRLVGLLKWETKNRPQEEKMCERKLHDERWVAIEDVLMLEMLDIFFGSDIVFICYPWAPIFILQRLRHAQGITVYSVIRKSSAHKAYTSYIARNSIISSLSWLGLLLACQPWAKEGCR